MSGVELAACPFCGSGLSVSVEDIDHFIGHVECSGCDMRGPISEWKYEDPEEAKADAAARWNAAWNRRAVPMEAVAWREAREYLAYADEGLNRVDPWIGVRHLRNILAVIPAPGNKEDGK